MILQELFNTGETSYDLLVNTNRAWVAQVNLKDDKSLVFKAEKEDHGEWHVLFSVDDSFNVDNKSHNGAYVLSTVLFLLKEFEQQKKPYFISFTGNEDHESIYRALVRRFAKQQGWTPFITEFASIITFRLFKLPDNFFNNISVEQYGETFIASNGTVDFFVTAKLNNNELNLTGVDVSFIDKSDLDKLLEKIPDLHKFIDHIEDYLIENYEGYSFNVKSGLEKYFPKISTIADSST